MREVSSDVSEHCLFVQLSSRILARCAFLQGAHTNIAALLLAGHANIAVSIKLKCRMWDGLWREGAACWSWGAVRTPVSRAR